MLLLVVSSSTDDTFCPSGLVEPNAIYNGIRDGGTIDIDCLQSRGGDVNFIDEEHGWGPLILATFKGREDFVDELLHMSVD